MERRESKAEIRKRIRKMRDALPAESRAVWSQRIAEKAIALPEYLSAKTIHIYLSFESEANTSRIVEHAFANRKRVVVPLFKKDSEDTLCCEIESLSDHEFVFGKWGLRSPRKLRFSPIDEVDLVFAPCLAFIPVADGGAHRVGYGAGFYDRFLKRIRPDVKKIGLAFETQRVEFAPIDAHDVLLDFVLTEAET
jgi:5-formyltetrahydrofolate cyclo-ligase